MQNIQTMTYYTDDYKFVKQYLQHEFALSDIDQIMDWVEEYDGNIGIAVENDEWVRGDEDLMDFIQEKLLGQEKEEVKPKKEEMDINTKFGLMFYAKSIIEERTGTKL